MARIRGSLKPIDLTQESHELLKAVEESACAVGAATTLDDIETAMSVLNTARDRMARRLAALESEAMGSSIMHDLKFVKVKYL